MPGLQSLIQLNEPNRQMIADAMAEYYARGTGQVVAAVEMQAPKPLPERKPGPAPILFGVKDKAPRKPKPRLPEQERKERRSVSGACRKKRDVHVEKVRELAAKNYGANAIGREIGISRVTVRKIALENDIKLHDDPTRAEFDASMANGRDRLVKEGQARRTAAAPRVRTLAATGITRRQIAAEIGASVAWVERVAKEHNITISNRGHLPKEEKSA